MKKIYSFAIAAVALFSAASCQKELVNAPMTEGGDFTVTAIASAETKTVLVDGVKTYWAPGDKISVFNAEGNAVSSAQTSLRLLLLLSSLTQQSLLLLRTL